MSFNRLITRFAVVSALNNFMREPWPTIAGPNVFDSKIEPVEDMKADRAFPCIVVYTDYDKDHWPRGKKAHEKRLMTVTLELLIVQATSVPDSDDYKIDVPVVDSEIESSLDFFEMQIQRALTADTEAADVFGYLCPSYENLISRRGASIEGGQRLAARQITMEMVAARDNIAGTIPEPIEKFLQAVETNSDDYRERAEEIRQFMTDTAGQSPGDKERKAFGYSRDVAERIGRPAGPQVLLPQNLTYHYSGGVLMP